MQLFDKKKMNNFCVATIFVCCGTSLASQTAQIQFGDLNHDAKSAIEITSDSLSIDQATGAAVFLGNVNIAQGPLSLMAEEVEVIYEAGGEAIDLLKAGGGVSISNLGDLIEADNAIYDLSESEVSLVGNVSLKQTGGILSGDKMLIDLRSGSGYIEGRVKTILQPK